ncbi:hypothetical protein PI125_g10426 [Phytophthora idaei]|nr:hypothetical protein PI125_g10426 [Phytophthora idaei]
MRTTSSPRFCSGMLCWNAYLAACQTENEQLLLRMNLPTVECDDESEEEEVDLARFGNIIPRDKPLRTEEDAGESFDSDDEVVFMTKKLHVDEDFVANTQ